MIIKITLIVRCSSSRNHELRFLALGKAKRWDEVVNINCTIAHHHQSFCPPWNINHTFSLLPFYKLLTSILIPIESTACVYCIVAMYDVSVMGLWACYEMWANELLCNYQTLSCGLVPACTGILVKPIDRKWFLHLVAIRYYQLYILGSKLMTGMCLML